MPETAIALFDETLKIAAYGEYDTRKTLQIGHLIEAFGSERVFIASAEAGLGTIRSLVMPERVFTVNSLDDFRNAWAWGAERAASPDTWFVVDGGSRLMHWIANDLFEKANKAVEAMLRDKLTKDLIPFVRFTSDNRVDGQKVYLEVALQIERLLGSLIRMGGNLYVTFLEDMTETNPVTRVRKPPYGPDIPGRRGLKAVMSTFDYVLRLKPGKSGALAITGGDDQSLARTREDGRAGVVIPDTIPNFNLADFVRLIQRGTHGH